MLVPLNCCRVSATLFFRYPSAESQRVADAIDRAGASVCGKSPGGHGRL